MKMDYRVKPGNDDYGEGLMFAFTLAVGSCRPQVAACHRKATSKERPL
jgi:hypothetical protein